MTEVKVTLYAIAMVLLVLTAVAVNFNYSFGELEATLAGVRSQASGLERMITDRKAFLASRVAQINAVKNQHAKIAKLADEEAEEQAAINALIERDTALRSEISKLIDQTRASAVGLALGDLQVDEFKKVLNAKIHLVDPKTVTVSHSAGMLRIEYTKAPRILLDRLLLDVKMEAPLIEAKTETKPSETYQANSTVQHRIDTPEWIEYKSKLEAYEKRALEARLTIEALQNRANQLIRELPSDWGVSASKRYYANKQREAIQAQLLQIQRQIDASKLAFSRIEGEKPKSPALQYE